jgi:hypothetical protein
MQGSGKGSAASKAEGAGVGSPKRFGAFTGLELPKARKRIERPLEPEALPAWGGAPLERGLPNTPITACQELMLAVVVQGLIDDDLDYVLSPTFIHHCCYVGLDPDTALNIKIKYLRREIDPESFGSHFHRQRRVLND